MTTFAYSFETKARDVEKLRTDLDNALAYLTPAQRKAFVVADLGASMRAALPDAKDYKVVPSDTGIAVVDAERCTPSDHAAVVQMFEALRQKMGRQVRSVCEARGYKVEGMRSKRSDAGKATEFSAADTVKRLARNHTPAQLRAIARAILA